MSSIQSSFSGKRQTTWRLPSHVLVISQNWMEQAQRYFGNIVMYCFQKTIRSRAMYWFSLTSVTWSCHNPLSLKRSRTEKQLRVAATSCVEGLLTNAAYLINLWAEVQYGWESVACIRPSLASDRKVHVESFSNSLGYKKSVDQFWNVCEETMCTDIFLSGAVHKMFCRVLSLPFFW